MTTDAGTPTPWPIEDVVARDLSGWARSLYNCTTGDNHLRTSEYYQLIRDLDAYEIVIAAAREQIAALTAAEAARDLARTEAHAAVTESVTLEMERNALRARVAGLEASGKLLQQAHSAVLRSLQKQAPCFADTDRLDAMEKQSWTVGHYASGRYFVHLGLINGKQCETTGSALRIAIDEARALLAPSSEETK